MTALSLCLTCVVWHAAADSAKATSQAALSPVRDAVILVVGAAGTPEYGRQFEEWAQRWQQAAEAGHRQMTVIGRATQGQSDRDRLKETLAQAATLTESRLWLVLIGHGTFDGRSARFNLRGPDVSAAELGDWLAEYQRPIAILNCTSASGPFLAKLSAPGRIVLTATKSGYEHHFARFGDFLSKSIAAPEADLDKDGQTSLLEAFLSAARGTAEFYELNGRLATEHALLDDNGDKKGTRPDWFRGLRPVRQAESGAELDGYRAHQWHLVPSQDEAEMPLVWRQKRDNLELSILELRERKDTLDESVYFQQLESLLIRMAELYEGASSPLDADDVTSSHSAIAKPF